MRFYRGFTLIELLITTSILSILLVAITLMVQTATIEAGKSKVIMTATMLAQNVIETARNAPYASVGTIGGIPEGILPQTNNVSINGVPFTIQTMVLYVDDPYDDVAPNDLSPTDYKRVRVAVSWGGMFSMRDPVVMMTDISSKAVESDEGGGILTVTVFDALGTVLSNASVTITAPDLPSPVNTTLTTNDQGIITIPGATPCIECYRIIATKNGYTSDRTYGRDEVANPAKPHLSVFESAVSATSFTIDLPATVTFRAVRTAELSFSTFQGVNFRLRGYKEIGRTAFDQPVYKTDVSLTTQSGGVITRNNLEWDTYVVEIPVGSSVDLAASTPFTPFSVHPNTAQTFTLVVTPNTPHSLLVRTLTHELQPIASASVELRNESVGYIATQSTGINNNPDRAQAFFPNIPLTTVPYRLTIWSPNFYETVTDATISGDVVEDFILNPL